MKLNPSFLAFVILLQTWSLFPCNENTAAAIDRHYNHQRRRQNDNTKLKFPMYYYTYPDPSGNRVVSTRNNIRQVVENQNGDQSQQQQEPSFEPIDITFDDEIAWVVGIKTTTNETFSDDNKECNNHVGLFFRFVVTTLNSKAYIITPKISCGEDRKSKWTVQTAAIEQYQPLAALQPPLVMQSSLDDDEDVKIVSLTTTSSDMSPLSHPTPLYTSNKDKTPITSDKFIYIAQTTGDLVLWDNLNSIELFRLEGANALPDGRIVVSTSSSQQSNAGDDDKNNKDDIIYAVYGGATDIYRHCVLGDCIEATQLILFSVTLTDIHNKITSRIVIQHNIVPPNPTEVFEGISPMFITTENNELLIVATIANPSRGARLVAYDVQTGDLVSESDDIGWGWRHQLFYCNFSPLSPSRQEPPYANKDDNNMLVDVLTPHVRMTLEFFHLNMAKANSSESSEKSTMATASEVAMMQRQTYTSKYTTHSIGSRVLDTAVCVDLNGDGMNEAVLLGDDLQSIVGISPDVPDNDNADDSSSIGSNRRWKAEEIWRMMKLPDAVTTNIAVATSGSQTMNENDYKDNEELSFVALGIGSNNLLRMYVSSSSSTIKDEIGSSAASIGGVFRAANIECQLMFCTVALTLSLVILY